MKRENVLNLVETINVKLLLRGKAIKIFQLPKNA